MGVFNGAPPLRGGARARRRVIGDPTARVHTDQLGRLTCLSGELDLVGPSCIDGLSDLVSVSVVDDSGLRIICRTAGQVVLRCHEHQVELVGEIGVVVGSREDGSFWDDQAIRSLAHGDRVYARGILRRRSRPPQRGYRGPAQSFALEAFGGLQTIDVAFAKRPRGVASRAMQTLEAWTDGFLKPPAESQRSRQAYEPHPENVLRLANLARERRARMTKRVIIAPGSS